MLLEPEETRRHPWTSAPQQHGAEGNATAGPAAPPCPSTTTPPRITTTPGLGGSHNTQYATAHAFPICLSGRSRAAAPFAAPLPLRKRSTLPICLSRLPGCDPARLPLLASAHHLSHDASPFAPRATTPRAAIIARQPRAARLIPLHACRALTARRGAHEPSPPPDAPPHARGRGGVAATTLGAAVATGGATGRPTRTWRTRSRRRG